MPVEFLQFGGLVAVIAVVALLWYALVYKTRRTGEGDGAPRERDRRRGPRVEDDDKQE